MDSSTFDALKHRKKEIASAAERLRSELQRLEQEAQELEAAESVLARLGGAGRTRPTGDRTPQEAPKSQRQQVLEALRRSHSDWVRSADVAALVERNWGVKIPDRSLRPLLTSLKREGLVARRGRLIAIRERAGEMVDASELACA